MAQISYAAIVIAVSVVWLLVKSWPPPSEHSAALALWPALWYDTTE